MSKTPDTFPGPRIEEEVIFEPQAEAPTVPGAVRYVGDSFIAKDDLGLFTLRPNPTLADYWMLGSLLDYGAIGTTSAEEVQYTRVYLPKGLAVVDLNTYIGSGGASSRYVRMGIYDQADPASRTAEPRNRVAQTNAVNFASLINSWLHVPIIGGPYVVPASGFYWLAIICDSSVVRFALTTQFRENFLPMRREMSTGTTLPATAGTLTNPMSAVVLCAAEE